MATMRKLLASLSLLVMTGACSRITEPDPIQKDPSGKAAAPATAAATAAAAAPGASELQKVDVQVGTGAEAVKGKRAKVHYTGKLTDGTQFDSSVGRDPFTFMVGGGQVIRGWDEGVAGMKVGGKRKLTIPYQMAYGRPPKIPPKATLVFDIELLGVE